MHPMLKPALRRSWRERTSLQFGVGPEQAVVLESLDGPASRFLRLLDGTRGLGLLYQEAAALGLAPDRAERLLDELARGGVLDDADSTGGLSDVMGSGTGALERLRPDLASLSLVHREPGAAAARMAARRALRVRVRGAGRVGASLAAVLSAAGLARVDVQDGGKAEPWDAAPCGIPAIQVGERRESAARAAVRRAAPDPRPASSRSGRPAGSEPALGLMVLAPRDGLAAYAPDPAEAEPLVMAGIPHLYAGVVEGVGFVGPLVVPGRSPCAGCLELGRADADPAWPRILAQLRSGRPPAVPACDVALATLVAGLAGTHALAFLDGGTPPSVGARLEFSLSGLGLRHTRIAAHPECGCGCSASQSAARATMAG
ncbi:ThiF family adenylyltransferase [Streptomyces sp. RB6PN25]|uniref:ThiF family adenylyltransferase n=1 Tax=Streptomyces humicola TaxID=2953240 RepID=A0ABT1PRG4_9ACTN|nr:ThiF family adenylyltransferase [Streptomyces humicola]MCQ4080259.1 ThiF family adenylyltransferase [Streptomyces humicola]